MWPNYEHGIKYVKLHRKVTFIQPHSLGRISYRYTSQRLIFIGILITHMTVGGSLKIWDVGIAHGELSMTGGKGTFFQMKQMKTIKV